ncbi:MAG: hypothetical protein PHG34_08755 [Candidatus Cloacimonetes bacterium]|nr:hypothetical protein [Candidatus Cloacimonadota bacterium]
MIIAELQGKIPSKLYDKEDILTSNVFSFFKYSNRIFLKEYLSKLGISVSLQDANNAEFNFWQSFEDKTEPDLVIICGNYYLLFEAKLYSDFSPKTMNIKSQIEREISMGKMSAKNINKEFVYIALTAEYYKNRSKYIKYENQDFLFIWSNWQLIANFINEILELGKVKSDYEFALDLFSLLVKKNLRSFKGLKNLNYQEISKFSNSLFYNVLTSKFKGEFFGFIENLSGFQKVNNYENFFKRTFFKSLDNIQISNKQIIFYNENR